MIFQNKTIRYYYWIVKELSKKHVKLILFSFFLSFLVIFSLISFTPYFLSLIAPQQEIIGVAGQYDLENLPEEITSKISHGLISFATSWQAAKNDTQFKFYLKKNIFWDDGKPLTAHDINYQFKDVDVKVLDDQTIFFDLKKPLAIFPNYLAKPLLRKPLHGVAGLYRVDKIRLKYGQIDELVLSPNKDALPIQIYRFYDNEGKLINAYKRGEITQMTISKKSLADNFISWKNTKITKVVDYTRVLALFFNLRNKALQDKEVRQAIAASIPKDKWAEHGESADGSLPPTSWAYNPNIKKTIFNPDLAKKTLIKDETSLSARLEFKTYYDYLSTATEINDYLQKAGVKTNLSLSSFDSAENFDLLLAFWKINADPDQYYFWHSTQTRSNITGYRNVKIDKLLEDGRAVLNQSTRKKNYVELQKVMADDPPAIFIYYPYIYTIKRK